jgi:hypothetical protein
LSNFNEAEFLEDIDELRAGRGLTFEELIKGVDAVIAEVSISATPRE